MEAILDLLPIALAVVAIILLSKKFNADRRRTGRFVYFLATISSCLLIVAQFSWWFSSFIQGDLAGTMFANIIWTLFNSLVMVTFIVIALPRKRTKDE